MAKRPDRRVHRTKRRLKEALLTLITRQDYEEISIQDITDLADVGRSTFYSHFESKDDLLFAGYDQWLLSLAEAPLPPAARGRDRYRFCLPLLEHMRGQKRFFEATIGRGTNLQIKRKSTAALVEVVRREMDRLTPARGGVSPQAKLAREARAHALTSAFYGLVAWWLAAGDRMSIEAADEVFQRLALGS